MSEADMLPLCAQVTFQRPVEVGDLLQLRCHVLHTDARHDLGRVRRRPARAQGGCLSLLSTHIEFGHIFRVRACNHAACVSWTAGSLCRLELQMIKRRRVESCPRLSQEAQAGAWPSGRAPSTRRLRPR